MTNWCSPSEGAESTKKKAAVAEEPKEALETRPCHVLMISDPIVNSKKASSTITTLFNDCMIMCTFVIVPKSDHLLKLIKSTHYDILFVTKETLADSAFSSALRSSVNANTPVILYSCPLNAFLTRSKRRRGDERANSISLPLTVIPHPLYEENNVSVLCELYFPFTVLDIAYIILRVAFLPHYLRYNLNSSVLEGKRISSFCT